MARRFDDHEAAPYTRFVFRGVAAVVAVAMLSMSASAALLHVHASAGHEHAEHHHGPAAHSHAPVVHQHRHPHQHETATHGNGVEIEPCDPGDHVVPMVFACVAVESLDAPLPEMCGASVLAIPSTSAVAVVPSDVRAHSPPRITDAPLRAPPIAHLA